MPTNNYPNIGYRTQGQDYNYYSKVTVNTSTFGGGSVDGYQPDIIINLAVPTYTVMFNIEGVGGTNIVEYSFNGTTVHGELSQVSTTNRYALVFQNRVVSTVWFRVKSGSSGPLIVDVEAWAVR